LFGIVGALVLIDIIVLIPPTAVSSTILRREKEEIEGEEVSEVSVKLMINAFLGWRSTCNNWSL